MKTLLKKAGLCLFLLLLFAFIAIASINELAGVDSSLIRKPLVDITDSMNAHFPLLKKQFGKNKEMPAEYEKQIIFALSYFPELAETKIRFVIKKSRGGIISSRPAVWSFFRRSSKRTYLVIINDSTEGRKLPRFANCNVNGQVGVLGHEFCHIIHSNNQTGLGLMGIGLKEIFSKKYLNRSEYRTDSTDVERGLGYQLIAWQEYLANGFRQMFAGNTLILDDLTSGANKRYMNPEDVRRVMAKSELYK